MHGTWAIDRPRFSLAAGRSIKIKETEDKYGEILSLKFESVTSNVCMQYMLYHTMRLIQVPSTHVSQSISYVFGWIFLARNPEGQRNQGDIMRRAYDTAKPSSMSVLVEFQT